MKTPASPQADGPPGRQRPETTFELIPAIDLLDGKVVRLREGDFGQPTFYGSDAVAYANRWAEEGASRLHVVDLEAAVRGASVAEAIVREIIADASVPCEVAGGIRSAEAVERVLAWGAQRAVMGTALLGDAALTRHLVTTFGADRIIAAIDVRGGQALGSGWLPGTQGPPYERALSALREAGITTFEITAIARDGTQTGPDWALLERAAAIVGPERVIASGGVTTTADAARLAKDGYAGAILGRALYEGTLALRDAITASRRAGAT
jgi:phosphoribosylformimino-5-aminoimidazole carboxamide ribotide isomerase